jgi:hypothetical protein
MLTTLLDYLRMALYGVLIVILFLFYQAWEKEHVIPTQPESTLTTSTTTNYVPDISTTKDKTIEVEKPAHTG